jgi:hypothetical protein
MTPTMPVSIEWLNFQAESLLQKAEEVYLPRDMAFRFDGVRIHDEGPHIRFHTDGVGVAIELSPSTTCRAEALDLAAKLGKSGGLWLGRRHRSPMNDAGVYQRQPPPTHHGRSASKDRADLPRSPASDRYPVSPGPAACDHAREPRPRSPAR